MSARSHALAQTVRGLGRPRVLVVGDVILDRYVWGEAERVSQEAPVILLREAKREVRLGGAANVAHMLAGLGAVPVVAGVIGDDVDGRACRGELEASGVETGGLIADPARPTTVKERFLGRAHHRHPHQMLRVDREVREALSRRVEDVLLARIADLLPTVSAVLLSDYGKGVLTPAVAAGVIEQAKAAGVPVLADPPGSGACGHFRGATAITPNRTETGRAVGRPIETVADAEAAGRELCETHGLAHAFVTIDSDGIVLANADGSATVHPTRRRGVCDITGAGDVVLAVMGLAAAEGLPPGDWARLANAAGGIEVEKVGCAPVSRDEIVADLTSGGRGGAGRIAENADDLAAILDRRRAAGQTVVFTNGCFDLVARRARQSARGSRRPGGRAGGRGEHGRLGPRAGQGAGPADRAGGPADRDAGGAAGGGLRRAHARRHAAPPAPHAAAGRAGEGGNLLHRTDRRPRGRGGLRRRRPPAGRAGGLEHDRLGFAHPHPVRVPDRAARRRRDDPDEAGGVTHSPPPAESVRTLIAFLPNWVGDAVMATPALRALRTRFADARLIAACRPPVGDVLDGTGLADEIAPLPRRGPALRRTLWALRTPRADLAVLFPNSLRAALLARVSGARRRIGFARDGRGWLLTDPVQPGDTHIPAPVLRAYNRLARAAGCDEPGTRTEAAVTPADAAAFQAVLVDHPHLRGGFVALNTGGAFGAAKDWPRPHWIELARRLVGERNRSVLLLCGPAERDAAGSIAAEAGGRVASLADRPLSLGLTKAAIAAADALVTTDSGPRHFAGPLGTPAVTLFGPTHIAWSETFHPTATHLQLPVDCGPCQQRVCPLGHHRCMTELTADRVLSALPTKRRAAA